MHGRTVLLASRPSLTRREYQAALEQHGFEVQTADDAIQGIALLRESLPDLLVVEPELPWGGGDGLLEVMHQTLEFHDVPVFVLTAARDRSAMYRISQFASNDFAMQPLDATQFVERVRRLVSPQVLTG